MEQIEKQKNKSFFLLFLCFCLLLLTLGTGSLQVLAEETKEKKVAIIIDDLGNNMRGTNEILDLPVHLTVAVMPFLSTTQQDAELAHQKGHDVIVHLPMEPKRGKKEWLGPGAITTNLSDEEIRERVLAAIENVPHAIGINNHMGSKITSNPRIMKLILQICQEKGLFFIDSKTSYQSVIPSLADELQVPYLENHIFLDDINTKQHITKQFQLVLDHLEQHGVCIAIGHVGQTGQNMVTVMKEQLEQIQVDAQIVKVSQLIGIPDPLNAS